MYLNNFTQIVYPAKVQEKQVEQLRTQVVDLERFVDFLQGISRKKVSIEQSMVQILVLSK